MTNIEPNVADNGRYSVTEAAEILEINRKTLYSHTDCGNIKFGIRKANGRRFYTGTEIRKFWKAQF